MGKVSSQYSLKGESTRGINEYESEYVKNSRTTYYYTRGILKARIKILQEYSSRIRIREEYEVPHFEILKEYGEYGKEYVKNTGSPYSCIREVYELRIQIRRDTEFRIPESSYEGYEARIPVEYESPYSSVFQ